MIPHDYHIHSNFSADSRATMEQICLQAIALNIPEIGFAEHYDLHPDEHPRDWLRLEPWLDELNRCRARFQGRLVIRAGIEVGEPHLFQAEMNALVARAPFDYVIGSLHWIGHSTVFDPGFYRCPQKEAFEPYFEELERMTARGGFDVLGHLDIPVRSAFDIYGDYDPTQYESLIRAVLRNCIDRGIALDVNTSAFRRRAQVLLPGLVILRWYVEMGGSRVTLGSDAHQVDQVASHFDLAIEAIRAAGLKSIVQFDGRRSRLLPL